MNKAQRLAWLPDVVIDDIKAAIAGHLDPSVDISREDLVQLYQYTAGLTVDGWPGRKTAQALYGCGIPVASNRDELTKQLGMYGTTWERTGEGRRIRWTSDMCPDVVRVELHNGDYARIARPFADEFARLFRVACEASGYTPESVQTYNPRVIGGTDRLSMHAYGVAVDFDPDLNPWGGIIKRGSRKGEPSELRQHIAFVEVWEWAGWQWGGRWDGNAGDDMHVQRKN